MAFDPKTWAHGELITAEDLNRLELAVDVVDAKATETATAVDGFTVSVVAALGAGASAGTITLTRTGHMVTAELAGLVLTGTSEVVVSIPAGWGPARRSGHGYVEDTANGWWPTRATSTQVQVMGPAPAGTTVEGSISWKRS